MFERLLTSIVGEKPDDYHGSELLSQGSSYTNIIGATTSEQQTRLREVLPIVLEELYSDLAESDDQA